MTRRSFASWVPRRRAPDPIPESEPAPHPEAAPEPGAAPDHAASSGPSPEPAPAPGPPATDAKLVEVLTDTDRYLAQVDLGQQRLTDLLNREEEVVAFRIDPEADDLASEGAVTQEPVALDVLDILLAIAPPQYSDSARRLHRPRHWVEMKVGGHDVHGNIHVPAGAQPGGYLLRINPRFVPLTQARILTGDQERRTDVVLVNVRAVEAMKEIGRSPQDYAGQFTDEYPDYDPDAAAEREPDGGAPASPPA